VDAKDIFDGEVLTVSRIRYVKEGHLIDAAEDSASGFFYEHNDSYYFITNLHVVKDDSDGHFPTELVLDLHPNDSSTKRPYHLSLYDDQNRPSWLIHRDRGEDVDIVALKVNENFVESQYVIKSFNEHSILNLTPFLGQNLLVIGYPLGHYDIINNIPIIRDATVSSVSDISTKNKPFFVIDSKLQEGMSGSPITTKPPNSARSCSGRQIRFRAIKKYKISCRYPFRRTHPSNQR